MGGAVSSPQRPQRSEDGRGLTVTGPILNKYYIGRRDDYLPFSLIVGPVFIVYHIQLT